jgi:hypothetical protein
MRRAKQSNEDESNMLSMNNAASEY